MKRHVWGSLDEEDVRLTCVTMIVTPLTPIQVPIYLLCRHDDDDRYTGGGVDGAGSWVDWGVGGLVCSV